jgi:16S rRNA (adenine1518-N6/adenine1519-N6)-dimethyltransferase
MNNNLLKPTYLKSLCEEYNLIPSKKYGQNYLISEKPIREMIKASDLKKTDTIVEIGPGFGVLTLAVVPLVKKIISFEIEKSLEKYWEENSQENLEIIWGNALKKLPDFSSQLSSYKVLANLPYQITSNALRVIFEQENKPEVVVVMVQKEVAERIIAKPGDMSLLAVSIQYFGKPEIVCKVPSGSFWPAPKVDSAVLKINVINKTSKFSDEDFFRVVRSGFSNKRKQLWRNLSSGLKLEKDLVKKILVDVVGNEKVRAEELSVEDWEKITSLII